MMKSKIFGLVGVFLLLLPFSVFGSSKNPREIAYGSLQATSGSYVYCVTLAELINKKVPEAHITVIETGATIENLHLLYRGEIDIGNATWDATARAYRGIDEFKGKPNPNLRFLWPAFNLRHNVIVSQASGIKSLYELEGRKFNVGGTGTATEAIALRLFDTLGIRPKFFRGSVSLARDAMLNRQIDGFIKSGIPDPSVMEVSRAIPIRFLEISEADFGKCEARHPGIFTRGYVPANAYGKDLPPKDILCYIAVGGEVTTDKLPQDLVYKMAKAVYENKDALGKAYPTSIEALANYPESYAKVPTYLHAGVVQLCKEMGVTVPARVIPPEYKEKK